MFYTNPFTGTTIIGGNNSGFYTNPFTGTTIVGGNNSGFYANPFTGTAIVGGNARSFNTNPITRTAAVSDNSRSFYTVPGLGVVNLGNIDNQTTIMNPFWATTVLGGNGNNIIDIGFSANITVGDGNNTISASYLGGSSKITVGNGNNNFTLGKNVTVNSGTGKNQYRLSANGNYTIVSKGSDTIAYTQSVTSGNVAGSSTISLYGHDSNINLYSNIIVNDFGKNNTIHVANNSSVTGGNDSSILFHSEMLGGIAQATYAVSGTNNSNISAVGGVGYVSTINASNNSNSEYNLSNNVYLNATNQSGNTTLNLQDSSANISNAQNINLTLNALGKSDFVFSAGSGNQIINAAGSTAGLKITSSRTDINDNLVVRAGSGNDVFTSIYGNNTFSGGDGNNVFAFTGVGSGTTVVDDFFASQGNRVQLSSLYGLNAQNISQHIYNNDAGNAVLTLSSTQNVVFTGVSTENLHTNQFVYTA